ncbi:hypothetical protein D3C81_989870 [compost metagenome]
MPTGCAVESAGAADGIGHRQPEDIAAVAQHVIGAHVGTAFGQARVVEFEEVLRGQGQFRVDRVTQRQLLARQEQLLGFGSRHVVQLGQVQCRLAIVDAVGGVEQGLAPVHRVPAKLAAQHRLVADLGVVEHEGVEKLARRPIVVTVAVTAQAMVVGRATGQHGTCGQATGRARQHQVAGIALLAGKRVGIRPHVVIGMVVPAGGADPHAHAALVNDIQFGEQVQTLRDRAADAEVLVAVVEVGGAGNLGVFAFDPLAVAQLGGVVEAHVPVGVGEVQLECLGSRRTGDQQQRCQQVTAGKAEENVFIVVHAMSLLG